MLVPDGRQVLPPGWRPPAPLSVVVHYRQRGRRPDVLWTVAWPTPDRGRTLYLAYGPAGAPAGPHLLAGIEFPPLPAGAMVHVALDRNQAGEVVYAAPRHTLN